ncbi:MAG: hypothetical protein AAF483_18390 [Planctomycetota bacterium]
MREDQSQLEFNLRDLALQLFILAWAPKTRMDWKTGKEQNVKLVAKLKAAPDGDAAMQENSIMPAFTRAIRDGRRIAGPSA